MKRCLRTQITVDGSPVWLRQYSNRTSTLRFQATRQPRVDVSEGDELHRSLEDYLAPVWPVGFALNYPWKPVNGVLEAFREAPGRRWEAFSWRFEPLRIRCLSPRERL
jgi:hypothetical protein